MSQRLDYNALSADHARKYLDFALSLNRGSIESRIRHLVHIRASQLNGCAFCLDMHVKEAKIDGERELRLHHIAIWRESPLFDTRERAALEWTEFLTRIPEHGISDEVYNRIREHFSEKELSDLTFTVVAINGWNRLNAAFHTTPGVMDKALGLDKAGLV